jgi:hypothetical protein
VRRLVPLLLLGCVHTPPHDPPPGRWTVDTVRREQMTLDGTWCSWEAENLVYEHDAVWAATPPDEDGGPRTDTWCVDGGESARMVDVVAQDGPFLSTRLHEEGCCPRRDETTCTTWDLRTRGRAHLEDYDGRHAEWRWAKLQHLLAKDPDLVGWSFDRDAFLVRGGHVTFCGVKGGLVREVRVR